MRRDMRRYYTEPGPLKLVKQLGQEEVPRSSSGLEEAGAQFLDSVSFFCARRGKTQELPEQLRPSLSRSVSGQVPLVPPDTEGVRQQLLTDGPSTTLRDVAKGIISRLLANPELEDDACPKLCSRRLDVKITCSSASTLTVEPPGISWSEPWA